jgi:hypothetical protein
VTTAAPVQLPEDAKKIAESLLQKVEQLKREQEQLQLPPSVVPPQVIKTLKLDCSRLMGGLGWFNRGFYWFYFLLVALDRTGPTGDVAPCASYH